MGDIIISFLFLFFNRFKGIYSILAFLTKIIVKMHKKTLKIIVPPFCKKTLQEAVFCAIID